MTGKLFVYGTLRPKDEAVTHLLADHLMYNAGPFPYILPDITCDVVGVLLDVTDEDLIAMDRYEGVSTGLYRREFVTVYDIGTTEPTQAWVYVGGSHWPTPIKSGDWYNKES